MTFTFRQALLWIAISLTVSIIVLLLFVDGLCSLFGLSVALNLYLSWRCVGHEKMLRALGLEGVKR